AFFRLAQHLKPHSRPPPVGEENQPRLHQETQSTGLSPIPQELSDRNRGSPSIIRHPKETILHRITTAMPAPASALRKNALHQTRFPKQSAPSPAQSSGCEHPRAGHSGTWLPDTAPLPERRVPDHRSPQRRSCSQATRRSHQALDVPRTPHTRAHTSCPAEPGQCLRTRELAWRCSLSPHNRIKPAGVAQNANPHTEAGNNHQQSSQVSQSAGQQSEFDFQQNANRQQRRSQQKNRRPPPFPYFSQADVGLEQAKQHGQNPKLGEMRMRCDVHSLLALKLTVIRERLIHLRPVLRCSPSTHLREQMVISRLMPAEISAGVIGSVQKSQQHQQQATCQQQPG